jgi:hypothetical protein
MDAEHTVAETAVSNAIATFQQANVEFVNTHTKLLNLLERDTKFREPVNGKLRHVLSDGSIAISVVGTVRVSLYLALRRLYNWDNMVDSPDLTSPTFETEYAPSVFISLGETLANDVALVTQFST